MPLVRVEVRNVYGLGKTELHRDVDREDPKAILDGVAVSGLVGILRQLGDLTEFAAEIFHGIQEEVILTSSRSNKLKTRLKQIEATVPSIEKSVVAQTNHIQFAYTGGLEWHPRIPNVQDYFVYDDLPQFIMAPYDDCRDPPRLHLLDKFDINGPGSCLKRYSDPTHFKRSSRASKLPEIKKKEYLPRSRDISLAVSMANQSDRKTLTSLSFSGRTSSSKTPSTMETESKSDLQDHRSCSFDSRSGGEKLKDVSTSSRFTPGPRTIASVLSESESEDANDDNSPSQDQTARGSSCVSWHEKAEIVETEALKLETDEVTDTNLVLDAEPVSQLKEHRAAETVQDIKLSELIERDSEDETESEEDDDFVDALYTIDSESDNEQEVQKTISDEITEEEFDNYVCEKETENISHNFSQDNEAMCAAASDLHISSPMSKPDEMIHQDPWEALDISNGTPHSYSNGFSNPLYDTNGVQENQESEDESSCDNEEETKLWTNGNLLGLKPSKPKIVEETIQETDAEPLREEANKAAFDWLTSSPQLDHMKISFSNSGALPSSKLKLKLPDEYTFSSFQLVPKTTASLQDSDSDKDTFCGTSSYISDNSDNHSVSISEKQTEEESGERKSQQEDQLYDSSQSINAEASFLSAPSSQFETSNGYLAGKISYLQNPADPLPPPLPPLQWMVSKVPSGRFEDNNKLSFKDTLTQTLEQQRSSLSSVKRETSNNVIAYDPKQENNKQSFKDTLTRALEKQRKSLSTVKKEEPKHAIAYDPKSDSNKQSFKDTLTRALEKRSSLSTIKKEESSSVIAYAHKPYNNVKDNKQSHGNVKESEAEDFLHQIRTKQFTLRRVVTTKASSSEATMNNNFSVILDKANSIRQAVASDHGDGESDSWSDSDT